MPSDRICSAAHAFLRPEPQRSPQVAVLAQQRHQVGESLAGGGAWVELEVELGQSAAILALSSALRAFSFFSCSISFSSCFILCSCAILRFSNSISLISYSTTGCQLSNCFAEACGYANQHRQRGKEERNSDLLIELEGGDSRDVDMIVSSKEGDQGEQQAGQDGDPALEVDAGNHTWAVA